MKGHQKFWWPFLFGRRASPYERKPPDFGDIFHHIIRFFLRPRGHLRLKLAVAQTNGMHSQFPARTDFTRGAIADNENLMGLEFRLLLDLAEGCFLGQHVAAISVINL